MAVAASSAGGALRGRPARPITRIEAVTTSSHRFRPDCSVFVTVIGVTVPVAVGAVHDCGRTRPPWTPCRACVFFVAALAAEFKPVPLDEQRRAQGVAGVRLPARPPRSCSGGSTRCSRAMVSMAIVQTARPRGRRCAPRSTPPSYALSAFVSAAARLPARLDGRRRDHATRRLTLLVFLGGAAYVVTNVVTVAVAVSLVHGRPLREMLERLRPPLRAGLRHHGLHRGAGGVAVDDRPAARAAAGRPAVRAGALPALRLPQRARHARRRDRRPDRRCATTARSRPTCARRWRWAPSTRTPLSLVLIDIDNFKSINDRFGHPVGDAGADTLARTAARGVRRRAAPTASAARSSRCSCPDDVEQEAYAVVRAPARAALADRVPARRAGHGQRRHRGVPRAWPATATSCCEVADAALYWAKNHGKNRSCIYSPSVVRIVHAGRAGRGGRAPRPAARRRGPDPGRGRQGHLRRRALASRCRAWSRASPARWAWTRRWSSRCGWRACCTTSARSRSPTASCRSRASSIRTSCGSCVSTPTLGYRLLEGLGVSPVDRWIRHHHEWWDGCGYPLGLAGEDIPLGSRIILVADAFDAMTSDRCYRAAGTRHATRSPSCAGAAGRSSTRASSPRSSVLPGAGSEDRRAGGRRQPDGAAPRRRWSGSRLGRLLGGRLGRLADMRIAAPWLFYLAIALQVAGFPVAGPSVEHRRLARDGPLDGLLRAA